MFTENMAGMHLLSFLLTANPTKAEECFVGGLGDCVGGSYVFRDWAQSWARRTIIQNAIRMLAPRNNYSAVTEAPSDPISCHLGRTPEAGYVIGSILCLKDFERFVFVVSVLEKYTDHDCSILLGCNNARILVSAISRRGHLAESSGQRPLTRAGSNYKDHQEAATRETQMEPQY